MGHSTTVRTTHTNGQEATVNLSTTQRQTIAAIAESLLAASQALGTLVAQPAEPEPAVTDLVVDARPNGLLTAASGKAICELFAGTPFADVKVNGSTKAAAAVQLLQALNVQAVVRTPDAPTVEAPVTDEAAGISERAAAAIVDLMGVDAEARGYDPHGDGLKGKELAAWLRQHGVVPMGKAWELARKGERDLTVLKAASPKGTDTQAIPALVVVADVPPAQAAEPTTRDLVLAALVASGLTHTEAEESLTLATS